MSQAKLVPEPLYLLLLAISLLLVLPPCTVLATEHPPYKPLVAPITKDPNTSLYTISIKNDAPLVVDLAGPLIWSTCPSGHRTVPCRSGTCAVANRHHPKKCPYVNGGRPGSTDKYCTCTAYPYNPVTGQCGAGDLTSIAMSANATDGSNPLYPVSFSAVASCAPDRLVTSFPAGASGVAGLSRWPLSLPSQLAAARKFGNKFVLCLPGVAIFGNTTVYFIPHTIELTTTIYSTPLLKNPKNAAYYLPVKSIIIYWDTQTIPLSLPRRALDLDVRTGHGGVVLSTVTPYTTMRPDVYRAFIQAYDTAMSSKSYVVRVPAVKPFELCYDRWSLRMLKRTGYDVPAINLELAGARTNWTVYNGNSLVQVSERVVCLAFVEMGQAGMPADDEPAVVIGGFQLEDNFLVFDLDQGVLGFSMLLWGRETSCRSFNFTISH